MGKKKEIEKEMSILRDSNPIKSKWMDGAVKGFMQLLFCFVLYTFLVLFVIFFQNTCSLVIFQRTNCLA